MHHTSCPTLLVVLGPTAVGKTALSLALAERCGSDIVSADSRQVFRELRIGVARPAEEELARVHHWFVATKSVTERFSSGQYEVEALALLRELFSDVHTVIAAGGSMLYIDALCDGLDDYPAPDMALRERLNRELSEKGVRALAAQLESLDPTTWRAIDRRNGARVVRALEVCLQTGVPFSKWRRGQRQQRPFRVVKVGLRRAWDDLERRIALRVDEMLAQGLEEEVSGLVAYRHLVALKSVGYSEMFAYLDGACTLAEARERIIVNTRRYAKRQMRWWARDKGIVWFDAADTDAIIGYVQASGVGL